MYQELAIFAVFVFCYSIVSGRVERAAASGPIVFVFAGLLMGPYGLGWFDGNVSRTWVRILADLTLATILFIDAANASLSVLKKHAQIPSRILLLGLPGVIILGTLLALLMFDQLSIYQAIILGTMLAATDAALGKAVITNKLVPARIREGLNFESGLNDGLCVPVLLLFIALALGGSEEAGTSAAVILVAKELGIGLAVGLSMSGAGYLAGYWCYQRGWISDAWLQITPVALAIGCFAVAQSLHGSGYIAAFSGGILFGYMAKDIHKLVHTSEGIGETLALMIWFIFGAVVLGRYFGQLTWEMVIYALLSLTVIRVLPIYLSLAGTGERPSA